MKMARTAGLLYERWDFSCEWLREAQRVAGGLDPAVVIVGWYSIIKSQIGLAPMLYPLLACRPMWDEDKAKIFNEKLP